MDKDLRSKDAEGASSDEEAFESADEGEEGAKSSKPPSATSAGIESANSTSKKLIGTNDTSVKTPVILGVDIKTETTELDDNTPKMDGNMPQEKEEKEAHEEDISCTATDSLPCSEEGEKGIEENIDIISAKLRKDVIAKATESKRNDEKRDEFEPEKVEGSVRSEEDKLFTTDRELEAEESPGPKDSKGQNEQPLLNLDQEPRKENVESSRSENSEDVKPGSSTQKPAEETSSSGGGWGWGGWASVLSQATASVTSGLSSVIETVETSLGVPDPEEMARKVKDEERVVKEKAAEKRKEEETSGENKSENVNEDAAPAGESFFSAFGVSSLTSAVQSTGKDLVSGGLDALEFIGKKTMNVLAEGDPGLRQKREKLAGKGPTLSQMLKLAKEESEQTAAAAEVEAEGTKPTVELFSEFDKFQGLAHLEALEMLSRDSEAKLESCIIDLTEEELAAVKPLLRAVEEVFHIDENEADDELAEGGDFKSEVVENVRSLNLPFTADKLLASQERAREWITICVQEQDSSPGSKNGTDIYTTAVSSMAELTARTVELFHKFSELLLHQAEQPEEISSLVRAQCMRKMSDAVLEEVSVLATHFAGCLNTAADDSDNPDSVSSLITTLYLDSSTSADYLRNSLKLLRPVLQLSSLNEKHAS